MGERRISCLLRCSSRLTSSPFAYLVTLGLGVQVGLVGHKFFSKAIGRSSALFEALDQQPTPSSFVHEFSTMQNHGINAYNEQDGEVEFRSTRTMGIPFFGCDNQSTHWSHLNHRVEEYRNDLVKVVETLDKIIRSLESGAALASVGAEHGDMPGEGMLRLAAKLRRKLDLTPPRWQVNIDVLSWLLRPVPFVAGLPGPPSRSPIPTRYSPSNDNGDDGCDSNSNSTPVTCVRGVTGGGVSSAGDAGGVKSRKETVRTDDGQDGEVVASVDTAAGQTSGTGSIAVGERRAVLMPSFPGMGLGGGDKDEEDPENRAKFYSYDETHQIFTHILRDWTTEGDSVRAAVYDPLLRAMDEYVGWQDDATATNNISSDGSDGASNAGAREWRRRTANVLIPGAGLGRLAVEAAAKGYASVHANELSTTMLSSCYWLMEALRGADLTEMQKTSLAGQGDGGSGGQDSSPLSPPPAAHRMKERDSGDVDGGGRDNNGEGKRKESWTVGGERGGSGGAATRGKGFFRFYPFLNDAAHNEVDGEARFRSALFPDPAGRAVLERASGRLSFQAGEFSATYGAPGGPYEGFFHAVVTSFFVDTAPNVVQYVATIRRALRPGGVWINCGPLHWHTKSALALSLDEILVLVSGSGFRLAAVEQLPRSAYRVEDEGGSLRIDEFRPVFWVAVSEGGGG